VIEDSDLAADDLAVRLAGDELQALCLLTHDDAAELYEDYVQRIIDAPGAAGDLARTIKQADMPDNLRRCARDHDPVAFRRRPRRAINAPPLSPSRHVPSGFRFGSSPTGNGSLVGADARPLAAAVSGDDAESFG
jgi:hypothetical protein